MTGILDIRFGFALVLCADILTGSVVVASTPATQGVVNQPCPSGATAVTTDSSIQAAVDQSGPNAAFCLKTGIHRIEVVRPLDGRSFYGEGGTILNGSRLLTEFSREGSYWIANGQTQHGQRHGECMSTAPACDLPEAVFIDDQPLNQVLSKDEVKPGQRHLGHRTGQRELFDHHRWQQSLRRQCLPCPDEQGGTVSLGAPSLELGWAARGWVGAERQADVLLTRWAR